MSNSENDVIFSFPRANPKIKWYLFVIPLLLPILCIWIDWKISTYGFTFIGFVIGGITVFLLISDVITRKQILIFTSAEILIKKRLLDDLHIPFDDIRKITILSSSKPITMIELFHSESNFAQFSMRTKMDKQLTLKGWKTPGGDSEEYIKQILYNLSNLWIEESQSSESKGEQTAVGENIIIEDVIKGKGINSYIAEIDEVFQDWQNTKKTEKKFL